MEEGFIVSNILHVRTISISVIVSQPRELLVWAHHRISKVNLFQCLYISALLINHFIYAIASS